jgi:hypothetical protein
VVSPVALALCDRELLGGGPGGGPGRGLLSSQCLSRDGDRLSVPREEELAVEITPIETARRAVGGIMTLEVAGDGSYWAILGFWTTGAGTP